MGVFGGNIRTDLSHEGDEGDLANISRFSGHVGAGENLEKAFLGINEGVIGNKIFFDKGLFENWMAALDDL